MFVATVPGPTHREFAIWMRLIHMLNKGWVGWQALTVVLTACQQDKFVSSPPPTSEQQIFAFRIYTPTH
jgi:hypothetical protein